jgi:hypothetical protein
MCCKQKTYVNAKPFRCNTYTKPGGWVFWPILPTPASKAMARIKSSLVYDVSCFASQGGNAGESRMMNKHGNFRFFLALGFLLALAGVLWAQSAPSKILVVNGKSAGPSVRQIDGHSYIDIEALARVTNGVVTIERTRIVLTMPVSDSEATAVAASAEATPAQPPQGLSRGFSSATIAALADMREMRGAIRAMITYGLAVSDTWTQDDHARVMTSLRQAEIAATTEDDQRALQLLQNEADKLATWADSVFAARQALNGAMTVDPNALQNDPALAKIQSCGRFLNAMVISGAFADDASCH